jgi:hypothetical protein
MRAIDTLLCATTHYGVCESGALHDTGELPGALHDTKELPGALHDTGKLTSALHDTGELPGALHDTGELTRARQDTGEVQTALSNKTFPSPQTHCLRGRLCLLGFPLQSIRFLTALTLRIRVRAAKISG